MTKPDSLKQHKGPPKSSRGPWWNTLQFPVKEPCRRAWPKWPPGVTKLNVILSVLQLSVVSLAFYSSYTSLCVNSTMKSFHDSPLRLDIVSVEAIFWQSQHLLHLLYKTDHLLLSCLLSSPAGAVVLSSLPLPPVPFSRSLSSLIYCEMILPLLLMFKAFCSVFLFCKKKKRPFFFCLFVPFIC